MLACDGDGATADFFKVGYTYSSTQLSNCNYDLAQMLTALAN